jgi:hypothetical protein
MVTGPLMALVLVARRAAKPSPLTGGGRRTSATRQLDKTTVAAPQRASRNLATTLSPTAGSRRVLSGRVPAQDRLRAVYTPSQDEQSVRTRGSR